MIDPSSRQRERPTIYLQLSDSNKDLVFPRQTGRLTVHRNITLTLITLPTATFFWQSSLTHSLTHGAEPFLRSCQLCSHSTTSQRFREPEGSLPPSQKPSTGPYHEPDRSNPYHPILSLSKLHFSIVHPPTSWSSQWFLSFWIPHQYCI
jgi:hypothetical protein